MTGGFGAGKTETLVVWALHRGIVNAPHAGLIIEPTYDQIETVFMDTMLKILLHYRVRPENIKYDSKQHNLMLRINGKVFTLRLRSADKAKNLAGSSVAFAAIDEADYVPESVIRQVKARVRLRDANFLQTLFVGTPEDVGGWWNVACEIDPDPNMLWVRARSYDNVFLPEGYLDNQFNQLSPDAKRQYLEGYWVRMSGTVYTSFDKYKHVVPLPDDHGLIEYVMGCDFGQGLMYWALGVKCDRYVHFFDEVCEVGIKTPAACDIAAIKWAKILERWTGKSYTPYEAASEVTCYIDPMGNPNRKHTSSDGMFMKNAGFNVKSRYAPIPVRKRVATMDYRIGEGKMLVDPNGCPQLLKSLINQGYGSDGEPEKWKPAAGKQGMDHANDAVGYLFEYVWPLRFHAKTKSYSYA